MKYSPLLFILLFPFISPAQKIKIVDLSTGQALEQVSIVSTEPRALAITDENGVADISEFKEAKRISFYLMGYKHSVFSYSQLKKNSFYLQLQKEEISLDQAVVSASRWNQSQREVPARVSVISPASVALHNPQTAADLLGSSGEVFVQKSQLGGGSPMIRGFSTNRLLLSIDGIRMNTAIFRSGNLQNVISLDPFAIQHTEVLFGPGSVIYGSDAIGGVMSFHTLEPQFSLDDDLHFSGKAVTRYASASNEKTAHLDFNLGWKKWSSVSSFSYTDYNDLKMGSYGPDEYLRTFYVERENGKDVVKRNEDPEAQKPSGYAQLNLMQKIKYRPNKNWDFLYAFHYSTTSDFPRYDRLIRIKDGLPDNTEWNYGPQLWNMHQLKISHNAKNLLYDHSNLRLAFQHFEESRITRDFQHPDRTTQTEFVDALSANWDFEKELDSKHKFFYGLEAVWNEVTSDGIVENIENGFKRDTNSRYPQSSWHSYAAYLSHQWKITEKFLLQSGARYNVFGLQANFRSNLPYFPLPFEEAELNKGALTASLGMAYNPSPTLNINAGISSGFRSPNVDDIGKIFDPEPQTVVIPNPDLGAEYAYNIEAGFAKTIAKRIKIDFSTYYTFLDDALVRRPYQLNGQDFIMYAGEMSEILAIQNAAFANVFGFQTGLEVYFPYGLGLSGRYNFQYGREELENGSSSPSRHAAPDFGIGRLYYKNDDMRLELNIAFSDEVSFDEMPEEESGKEYIYASNAEGNPYSPAWYTLNLKAMYKINEIMSFSLGVENITDQRYRPYSSGLVAPGRNFICALKATF